MLEGKKKIGCTLGNPTEVTHAPVPERGCVQRTSRSNKPTPRSIENSCGWSFGHSRAPNSLTGMHDIVRHRKYPAAIRPLRFHLDPVVPGSPRRELETRPENRLLVSSFPDDPSPG